MVTYLCVHFSSYIAAILFVFAFSFATNSNVGVFLKCLKRTCYVTLKRKEMFFRFCCFSCRAFFCRFLVPNAFLFGSDEYSTVPKKRVKSSSNVIQQGIRSVLQPLKYQRAPKPQFFPQNSRLFSNHPEKFSKERLISSRKSAQAFVFVSLALTLAHSFRKLNQTK